MPISTPQGDLLYRFVVIADTHVNESDDRAASFFALNRLANARAERAFAAAAALQPAFVMHLGDIVHPLPCSAAFDAASKRYRELERAFDCTVHLTPGNHDIGDKRWPLAPVAGIEPDFIRDYERVFGDQWHEWKHGPCRFFALNTSLMNSDLPDEQAQREWFESRLSDAAPGERIFLALHYPPYLRDEREGSHYDNIDEPSRSWLLGLLRQYGVEAVFCGHVHNFWYDQHGATEMYLLPSTAFVRQDYSDLQRITPPGAEGGRQDVDKLGFFVVDVHEKGHIARFMRLPTSAETLDASLHAVSPHPKRPVLPNLGIDLSYPWAEDVDLPPNPALDEFRRKRVRNDYPLLALFELGTALVRVPVEDLDDDALVARLAKLARTGFRMQIVVSTGALSVHQRRQLQTLRPALDSVEWVLAEDVMPGVAAHVAGVMRELDGVVALISKLRRPQDAAVDGLKYGHLVFHGWVAQEASRIAQQLSETFGAVPRAGAVLRVRLGESVLGAARQADELSRACRAPLALVVRTATDDPAGEQPSDAVLTERAIELALAAWRYPSVRLVLDGLVDVDRGYFRRLGLIDRAFNPRRAARSLRHLQVLLSGLDPHRCAIQRSETGGVALYDIACDDTTLRLRLDADSVDALDSRRPDGAWYSLVDGGVRRTPTAPL